MRYSITGPSPEPFAPLFADPDCVYIYAHNAAYGCFAARIERDAA